MTMLPRGIGTDQEVNQANQWKNEQPWYTQQLQQYGQDQNNVHLSRAQQTELLQTLRQKGVGISDHFDIDESGNIRPKSGMGKKILIAAAIGGVALTGLGLAGVGPMAGLFGTGATTAATGAGATAAAGGVLPSTAIGTGMVGLEAGAIPVGMVGGLSTGAGAAIGTGGSTLETIAGAAGKGLGAAGDLLRFGAQGVAGATDAAGNNRMLQENAGLTANQQNIQGNNAFENQLMNRADLEMKQRHSALKDSYRESYLGNPRVSPFDPAGAPKFSDAYRATVGNMAGQGNSLLAAAPMYQGAGMPALKPYTPLDIKDVQASTGTTKGTLEKAGDWLAPGLTTTGAILQMFGKR